MLEEQTVLWYGTDPEVLHSLIAWEVPQLPLLQLFEFRQPQEAFADGHVNSW